MTQKPLSAAVALAIAMMGAHAVARAADVDVEATATAPTLLPPATKPGQVALPPTTGVERSYSPYIGQIRADYAYKMGDNGKGVKVGVIDTGIRATHTNFRGGRVATGYNALNGTTNVTDQVGHGSHVAGLIGGNMDGVGSFGVAWGATLVPIKVFGATGSTSSDILSRGVVWAAQQKLPILNMSVGSSAPTIQPAIQTAVNAGALIVAAAGNSGGANPDWPARYATQSWARNQIIAVGAVDANNRIASFSNRAGDTARWYLVAPGVNLVSSYHLSDNTWAYMSGTSMAAPVVSGAAALLKGYWPQLTAPQMSQILFSTATRLCSTAVSAATCAASVNPDLVYGWGLVNVERALQPIGTVTTRTATGTTTTIVQMSLGSGTGSVATGVRAAAADGAFVIAGTDSFNRQYNYDMGSTLSKPAPLTFDQVFGSGDRLMQYGELALDRNGSRAVFALDAQNPAMTNLPRMGYGLASQFAPREALLGAAMIRKLDGGAEVAMGMGGMNVFFGLAGAELKDAPAFTASGLSNPYFGLVSSASSFGVGQSFGNGYKVKLGVASTTLANATLAQMGYVDASVTPASLSMLEVSRNFGDTVVGLGVGALAERGAMLGSRFGNGFALSGSGQSQTVTLQVAHKLAPGLAAAGYLSQGSTLGFSNQSDGFVTGVSNLKTQGAGLGLVAADAFRRNDRLMLSVSTPLKVVSGSMQLDVPTGVDANGNATRELRSVSLAGASRETMAEATYVSPVSKTSAVSGTLMVRSNVGGVSGSNDVIVGLRYRGEL